MIPEKIFVYFSAGFLGWLFWLGIRSLFSDRPSHFRVREADRNRRATGLDATSSASDTGNQRGSQTFLLEGFVADRPDHEVLGVGRNATPEEINKSYKTLMKQYHPDRVGRPGSREWTDAQKIAERINQAKSNLIQSSKKR